MPQGATVALKAHMSLVSEVAQTESLTGAMFSGVLAVFFSNFLVL